MNLLERMVNLFFFCILSLLLSVLIFLFSFVVLSKVRRWLMILLLCLVMIHYYDLYILMHRQHFEIT